MVSPDADRLVKTQLPVLQATRSGGKRVAPPPVRASTLVSLPQLRTLSSVLVLSSGARTLAGATLLRRKRGLRDEAAASPPSSLQQAAEQPGACAPDHHVQPSAVLMRARCERQFIFCQLLTHPVLPLIQPGRLPVHELPQGQARMSEPCVGVCVGVRCFSVACGCILLEYDISSRVRQCEI